jgi:hypothetical protein
MGLPVGAKIAVRVVVALYGAAFGALLASALGCPRDDDGQPAWPSWIDSVCSRNVGWIWVIAAPLLFASIYVLLGSRFARFRRHAVFGLLAIFGLSLLRDPRFLQSWWIVYPSVLLAAAVGVEVGARWARLLVYIVSVACVIQWLHGWVSAGSTEFLRNAPALIAVLSLMPSIASMLALAFCCYVVATEPGRPRQGGG